MRAAVRLHGYVPSSVCLRAMMSWVKKSLHADGHMITIEVHNISSIVKADDPRKHAKMDGWFAVRTPQPWFNQRVRTGAWDGYYHFYNRQRNSIPTGFLPALVFRMNDAGWQFRLEDRREQPRRLDTEINLAGIDPHEHQQIAVKRIIGNRIGGLWFPRGICWLPTATGKTEVIAALCQQVPVKTLILVHKKDLLYQTAKRIEQRLGEEAGLLGDGVIHISPRIIVGMIQTIYTHLKEYVPVLQQVVMFISDESHHLGAAKTYQQVSRICPAFVRVALSATPFDKNDPVQKARLVGSTGPVIYKQTPQQMADKGITAPIIVHLVPLDDTTHWSMPWISGSGEEGAYDRLVVRNSRRNKTILQWIVDHKGPTLVIVSRLEHGHALATLIGEIVREKTPFLCGDEPAMVRERAFHELNTGKLRVAVATIADEGVDVPAIENLIMAAGGKSEIKFIQRVGRGARKKKSGGACHVLDFIDGTNKFLFDHSKERIQAANAAGYKIVVENWLPRR